MSPFDLLQDRIDRMFEDFTSLPMMGRGMMADGGFDLMPSLEMREEGNKVLINCELPGVAEQDVDIACNEHTLTISGEKKKEFEDKSNGGYRSERSYGRFSRSVELPFMIDPAKVDARFENGVLKLSIDKPAEAEQQARKIQIRH